MRLPALFLSLVAALVLASPGEPMDRAKDLQKALKQLAKDKEPDVRKAAADTLADMGGPEAVAGLVAGLKDNAAEVRKSVVEGLRKIGNPQAIDAIGAALKDPSGDVRESATIALVDLKDDAKPEAEPLRAVLGDSEKFVRFNSMVALSNMQLGTPAELAPVAVSFLADTDRDVQSTSLNILMGLGLAHPEVRAGLAAALSQSDPGVHRRILQALRGDRDLRHSLGNEDWVSWLKDLTAAAAKKETDPDAREAADAIAKDIAEIQGSRAFRACQLLTPEEAAPLVGALPDRHRQSNACYWVADGKTTQIVVEFEPFAAGEPPSTRHLKEWDRRQKVEQGFTVTDEPTLGLGAFLARNKESIYFFFAGTKAIFHVVILDDAGTTQPQVDGLRALAKKASSRL
jgi:HEAT repeat protein